VVELLLLFLVFFLIFALPGLAVAVWELVADRVSPVLDWLLSEERQELEVEGGRGWEDCG